LSNLAKLIALVRKV